MSKTFAHHFAKRERAGTISSANKQERIKLIRSVQIEIKQGVISVTFKKAGKERTHTPTKASQKRLSALLWDWHINSKIDIAPDPIDLTTYTAIVRD